LIQFRFILWGRSTFLPKNTPPFRFLPIRACLAFKKSLKNVEQQARRHAHLRGASCTVSSCAVLAGDRHRFGSRGSGATQFEFPGGVTTTSEPNAAVVVADTGNRRVSLFRVTSDHYGEGVLQLNFFFGHQVFDAPTGVEYDPARGLLVVADQVHQQPTRDWRPVSDGRKDLGTSTGVAGGAGRTGRHLLGAANGRKLFLKIHVKIQIVMSYVFACMQ